MRPSDGTWTVNGSPEHIKRACELSLTRLGVEAIGLYQFHRPDPQVPYADSIGALADLLDAGKIQMAGISNANPDQIRLAHKILGGRLASVQNQYSPAFPSSRPELDLCTEGLKYLPFTTVAQTYGVSPQRVCLAWMLATSPVVIPIPGSSRPATAVDSAAAADLILTPAEFARLDAIWTFSGSAPSPGIETRTHTCTLEPHGGNHARPWTPSLARRATTDLRKSCKPVIGYNYIMSIMARSC